MIEEELYDPEFADAVLGVMKAAHPEGGPSLAALIAEREAHLQ